MAKQMGGVLLKGDKEVLYTSKSGGTFKRYNGSGSKKDGDNGKIPQGKGGSHPRGASKNRGNNRKFNGERYNYGKMGHMAKDYSSCSNHMTGDRQKLQSLSEHKGNRVVVTVDNSRLQITHIGKTIVIPRYNSNQVQLQDVYHVPGMKKKFLSVAQLTSSGYTSRDVVFDEASS
ncbi:hypothetical protein Pint_29245 [Pistacia integerrima]|uniref:Uncharacterized protein n=1 Tax=Pistacia integerrima TaxID=434235 RepID=A0ACC0X0J6_9ROSI|nr:hypothetical protein Pint_29245 [Pistacia integerrima]